jgi:hypothetical protein
MYVCNFHFVNERECIFFTQFDIFPGQMSYVDHRGALCSSPGLHRVITYIHFPIFILGTYNYHQFVLFIQMEL